MATLLFKGTDGRRWYITDFSYALPDYLKVRDLRSFTGSLLIEEPNRRTKVTNAYLIEIMEFD